MNALDRVKRLGWITGVLFTLKGLAWVVLGLAAVVLRA